MKTAHSSISVSIAQRPEEIEEALKFCGSIYDRNYGTHWTVPPDVFFVARQEGEIVATGGLTFAALHEQIASERYYQLTDGMRHFIDSNRDRIVEFGRFASIKVQAAKRVLFSALSYSTMVGMDFIFAWANPTVSRYTAEKLGLNFWPIAVPLDMDSALNDSRWASPPLGFFKREQPPALHLGVIPFWENITKALAAECGVESMPDWQMEVSNPVGVAAMKSTSFTKAPPKLIRTESDVAGSPRAPVANVPNFNTLRAPAAGGQSKGFKPRS